jgi:hypothetical protein
MVDPFNADAGNVVHLKTSMFSALPAKAAPLTPSVLHRKYVLEGLSTQQIAEQTASSKTNVIRCLRLFNIPVRVRGASHGRPSHPPFGMTFSEGRLTPHPEEQKTIELIRQLFLEEKKAISAIVRVLIQKGLPTKTGKSQWHHEMVRLVLKRQGLAQ